MPANYAAGTFEKCAGDSGQVHTLGQFGLSYRLTFVRFFSQWVYTEARLSDKAKEPPLLLTPSPSRLRARPRRLSRTVLSLQDHRS